MAKVINIFGFIGSEWDGTTVKQVSDQLDAIEGNEVTVRISSGGGYVSDGLAIFNLLRNSKKEVRVEIIGQAYSIASVIAMAGDKVFIAQFADMMLHPAWTMTEGNAESLRETADQLDAMSQEIFNTYLTKDKVKSNEAKIKEYFDAETYIKAAECVELGLCDGILEEQASVRHLTRYAAVAAINPNKQQMNNLTKEEAKGMFDEFRNWISKTFSTKPKNASTPAVEGTLYYEGDTLAIGTKVYSDEAMTVPCPDGNYTTNDNVITVAGGEVTNIVETAEDSAAKIADLEAQLEAAKSAAAEAKAKSEELLAKASEFETKFAELESKVIGAGANPTPEPDAPVARKISAASIMNEINKRNKK